MSCSKTMRVLQSSDGQTLEVEESVAMMSQTIKSMIESDCEVDTIPIPNVTGPILAKIVDYCKRHVGVPEKKPVYTSDLVQDALTAFDTEFLNVDQETLFELILAANYLDVKPLLEMTCEKVASMMRGKTPEEIRETFHIENDYTPEEEEAIRKENAWAFE